MAPLPPLVTTEDLAEFPGSPFSSSTVAAAAGAVRSECGWHIAPIVTETLTVDTDGGPILMLPTLALVSVSEVRDMTRDTPTVLTGWQMSAAGMLSRPGGWPWGLSAVEVDCTHGYESCPPELLPTVVERMDRRVMQESLGSRSVSYAPDDGGSAAVLARYKLPGLP